MVEKSDPTDDPTEGGGIGDGGSPPGGAPQPSGPPPGGDFGEEVIVVAPKDPPAEGGNFPVSTPESPSGGTGESGGGLGPASPNVGSGSSKSLDEQHAAGVRQGRRLVTHFALTGQILHIKVPEEGLSAFNFLEGLREGIDEAITDAQNAKNEQEFETGPILKPGIEPSAADLDAQEIFNNAVELLSGQHKHPPHIEIPRFPTGPVD